MKIKTSLSEDKLPTLEEGSMRYGNGNKNSYLNRIREHSSCSHFIQIVKVILYLELIIFIGWIGFIYLSNNNGNINYNVSKSQAIHTPSDFNDKIDYESRVTRDRSKRSNEENEFGREICERRMNATREKVNYMTKQFILGETSDPAVIMLREKCRLKIGNLATSLLIMELISTTDSFSPTDEEWHTFALDIKQGIINDTDSEYHQIVEASGPPTRETVNELRVTVESMGRDYKKCERVISFGSSMTSPSIADLLNERDKCARISATLREELGSLKVQIVPGDPSDPAIVQLRQNVEDIAMLVAASLTVGQTLGWNMTIIYAQVANLTDQDWQNYIVSIKEEIMNSTDSEHRRQLEESGSSMQNMISELRNIANNHLNKMKNCNELENILTDIRESVDSTRLRIKRASELIPEQTCWLDEPDTTLLEERQKRHNMFNKYDDYIFEDLMVCAITANRYLENATWELREEFYYLLIDLVYEVKKLKDLDATWADYVNNNLYRNFTNSLNYSDKNMTSEAIFNVTVKFGQSINLHYLELDKREYVNDTIKPVYGKFIYLDDRPEELGLRYIRHILNAVIRLYFKLHDPSSLMCKSDVKAQTDPMLESGNP